MNYSKFQDHQKHRELLKRIFKDHWPTNASPIFQRNEMDRRVAAQARKLDGRTPPRWRRPGSAVPAEAWTPVPEARAPTEDRATGRSFTAAPPIDPASRGFGYRRIATRCDPPRRWTTTRRTSTRISWTAMRGPRRTMNHLDQPRAADPRRRLIPWVGNPAFNYGNPSLSAPSPLRRLFQRTGAPPFSDHSDGIKRSWTWDKRPTFLSPTNELRPRKGKGRRAFSRFRWILWVIENDMSPRWALWLKSSLNARFRCGAMLDDEFFLWFFFLKCLKREIRVESFFKLSCFLYWEFVFFESWPAPWAALRILGVSCLFESDLSFIGNL